MKGKTGQWVSAVDRHISGVQQDLMLLLCSSTHSVIMQKGGDQLSVTKVTKPVDKLATTLNQTKIALKS